MSLIST